MVLKEHLDAIQTNPHLGEHKFHDPFVYGGEVITSCERMSMQARGDREPLL